MEKQFREEYENRFNGQSEGRVKLELNLPLVRRNKYHFGEAAREYDMKNLVERLAIDDDSWNVSAEGFSATKKYGNSTVTVGSDFRSSVLEIKLPAAPALDKAVETISDIIKPVARASEKARVSALAYGSQPISKASDDLLIRNETNMVLERRLNNKLPYLGLVASEKVQISVTKEEMPLVNNVLNYYAPAIIALTANAAIAKGREIGFLDYMGVVSDMVDFNRGKLRAKNEGRRGIMHAFSETGQYLDSLLSFTPLFTIREGMPLAYVGVKSIREYLEKDGADALVIGSNKMVKISPEPVDFYCHECTCWTEARPRSAYGTVEMRSACMQTGVKEMVSVGALALGLAANAKEAWEVVSDYSFEDLSKARKAAMSVGIEAPIAGKRMAVESLAAYMLDIANDGLKNLNENVNYLDPLYSALCDRRTPAHKSLEYLKKNRLFAFIDSVRIKED